MDKKYWLVCITLPRKDLEGKDSAPLFKFYRVSTTDPFEVTVPLNTVAFGFVETEETEEQMLEKMVSFNLENNEIASQFCLMTVVETLYVIGKLIKLPNGSQYILNSRLGTATYYMEGRTIPID